MDVNHSEYQRIYEKEEFLFSGLKSEQVSFLRSKYGSNYIKQGKKTSIFKRILNALFEPMILILIFACIITIGINIGNICCGKEGDFYECIGILGAISLSVGLTVFMENKSEQAFEALQKLTNAITVTAIRDGEKRTIDYGQVVVGDILICEAGDKIVADGLIVECNDLEVEESNLTGESTPIAKKSYVNGKFESINMLYSGSYLKSGSAKILVLGVGENAQMGKIATNLREENNVTAPLSQKLTNLSKKISIFGGISAVITFLLSLLRLYTSGNFSFENVKEVFVQAVVLIVAAVPEGLPATVAIALALSVVKLAKSNAIIKKLVAAETVGCVSVICSDKTGTLTVGKMQVNHYVVDGCEIEPSKLQVPFILNNVIYNSTAFFTKEKGKLVTCGNSTEQALIASIFKDNHKKLADMRLKVKILSRESFSSKRKFMSTSIILDGQKITFIKGSIEKVLEFCNLSVAEKNECLQNANFYAKQAERVLAFAHIINDVCIFDGFCVISDAIRKEVYQSVKNCKKAGIAVKILTGDNKETAVAIARKLGLDSAENNILTGADVEKMNDIQLQKCINNITVIARSTPETKLRVVKILKKMGEIVAVTGDGVNDAPAVKNADIGICMGDGSEITKEASDIILLDNSFSIIIKA
ncbi:MAG: cation-transporting P-type ATPase, partial [Clostridia bacterium]|nr:cation-transporting P-type ATPase [Clostridia bacterium]